MAGPANVAASAYFTPGLTNSWSFSYTLGAPDLFLQSITLNLSPTDLKFDTAPGGFGSSSYLDIGAFNGTDGNTGLSGISATGAALDGGTVVTFNFSNFSPGSSFQFSADVDHPDPTLLSLQICGKYDFVCKAANLGIPAANTALLLAAQTVGPNGIAGASIAFEFGGANYTTASVIGKFQPLTVGDLVNGISQGEGLGAFDTKAGTNADVTVPEPACVATFGAGLGMLIALAGRRRRRI